MTLHVSCLENLLFFLTSIVFCGRIIFLIIILSCFHSISNFLFVFMPIHILDYIFHSRKVKSNIQDYRLLGFVSSTHPTYFYSVQLHGHYFFTCSFSFSAIYSVINNIFTKKMFYTWTLVLF